MYSSLRYQAPDKVDRLALVVSIWMSRTVSCECLLVERLPVSEPVQRMFLALRSFVRVVLPPRVLKRFHGVQGRPCRSDVGVTFVVSSEDCDAPGYKPTILPLSLPTLYQERQFSLYTVWRRVNKLMVSVRLC